MIKQNERFLFTLRSALAPYPAHSPLISMAEIMDKLRIRQKKGESIKLIQNETASIRIQKMKFDNVNQIVFMLIHYYDKKASDPVFGELKTGKLRPASKLEGEGIAISTHIAFSLVPTEDRTNLYETILEEAPGIGRGKLASFFTSEFRCVSDFIFDDNGTDKVRRPILEMNGRLSKGLEEDLKKGIFKSITLVKHKLKTQLDEDDIFIQNKQTIELKIKNKINLTPNKIVDAIGDAYKKYQKDYDDFVVQYAQETKRSKSVTIDTKYSEAMDVVFNQSEQLQLKKSIDQCVETFNNEIIDKMKELIIKHRSLKKSKQTKHSNKLMSYEANV